MPADVAVATAMLRFAAAIEANVDGVVNDVDIECLHDLRVAVRRTRSLLKLVGDMLPGRLAARYGPGFAWLSTLTTPVRDLDVHLSGLDELAGGLVAATRSDLDPFAEHLRRERDAAQRALVGGLRSTRFERLLDGWRAELTAVADSRPMAARETTIPVEQLAATRIRRAAKRVLRRARAITADSPPERIHDLRKRCKELRYLLEVMRPLCDVKAHRRVVKDLRRVQDVLGAFQDGEVRSETLRRSARLMQESDRPPADTLLAMGELSGLLVRHQQRARHDLIAALHTFLRPKTHRRIKSLLS